MPCSPPTRGWSVSAVDWRHHAAVLPADAGVVRRARNSPHMSSGAPRRCGGGPHGASANLKAQAKGLV